MEFFAFVVLAIFVSICRRAFSGFRDVRNLRSSFGRLATLNQTQRGGLLSALPTPMTHGEFRQRKTEVRYIRRRSGKRRRIHTRFVLYFGVDLGLGLNLTRQLLLSPVTNKLFGRRDLLVGDTEFDAEVVVEADDAGALEAFLTPARRFHIRRFLSRRGHRQIDDAGITVDVRGRLDDQARMNGVLSSMADLADQLVGDTPPPLSRAMNARVEGELQTALDELPPPTPDVTPLPDAEVLRGELLYAGGRYAEARDAFAEAAQADPEDTEAAAWRDRSAARADGSEPPALPVDMDADEDPPPLPPAEPIAPAVEPTEPEHALDATAPSTVSLREICDTLFAADVSSLRVNALFEDRFDGKEVSWSGRLKEARRTSFDLVFGNEPFTKTTLDVATVGSDTSERVIRAVLALPEADAESLRDRRGEEIRFRGRLAKCDPFMRTLFVKDAVIE